MNRFAFVVIGLVALVGCSNSSYSTVKTGPDRYLLSGSDPNRLQGNAYEACTNDGFKDYTVVHQDRNALLVQCERDKKSFLTSAKETAGEAWDSVKKAAEKGVEELRK